MTKPSKLLIHPSSFPCEQGQEENRQNFNIAILPFIKVVIIAIHFHNITLDKMLEGCIIIIIIRRRRRINRIWIQFLWCDENNDFLLLSWQVLNQLCYYNFSFLQAHCTFYVIWHMIKLITNLMEMVLAGDKKVVHRGISVSNLFLWSTVSQWNGLIQWYKTHISVLTIIMSQGVAPLWSIS